MINLSNQNWAYAGIGDSGNTMFSWSYIILPFLTAICLLYTVFSKSMRERIGNERWILLLIFGFSYFSNFSRGLVRHSLAEGLGLVVLWSSYLFLAMFYSCLKNNKKLLLPIFMFLMLCNNLLVRNSNFSSSSIVDSAVSVPAPVIESWKIGRFDVEEYEELKFTQDSLTAKGEVIDECDRVDDHFMTYWQRLRYKQEVVERVKLNNELENTVNAYALVLNGLLGKQETFVDFVNKTLLYSIIGKENPVYVSQSPLQLSGEFTQKQFINEIRGIPVVIMPLAPNNDSLDGIANVYRNYKVSEYIYQNYIPLCKYENMYAVWCLKDKYQEYSARIEELVKGTEYLEKLTDCEGLVINNAELTKNEDGTCTMASAGTEPMICELQNLVNTSKFTGMNMLVSVGYSTDVSGVMQLFYTTEKKENFTAEKVVSVEINQTGTADFLIPITEYTRLRLKFPEGSAVTILSFSVKHTCDYIDYGYDGPIENVDANGHVSYNYISALHNHDIRHIPKIWAEGDTKNSINNQVITKLTYNDGVFIFDTNDIDLKEKGNYLKISAAYDGNDTGGLYKMDDETMPVTVIAGHYEDGRFVEKCRFTMTLSEGNQDYLIRISTDYYWYLKEINAVQFPMNNVIHDVNMQILEGD